MRFTRLATVSMLGVIALLVNSVIAFYALKGVRDSDKVVEHSNLVRSHIQQLLTVMTDAETGQRGFLLTGDPGYLAPYRNSRTRAAQFLQLLRSDNVDDADQLHHLAELQPLVEAKLAELEDTIQI